MTEKIASIRSSVVDLDKIRKEKGLDRSMAIRNAHEAKKKQKELIAIFKEAFKQVYNSGYELTAARYITRKNNEGTRRVRIDSDAVRLWSAFKRVEKLYGCNDIVLFKDFIVHALKVASGVSYVDTPRQAFGFVTSEKVQDEYFFSAKKGMHSTVKRNENVSKMEERHANLFKQDS